MSLRHIFIVQSIIYVENIGDQNDSDKCSWQTEGTV